MKQYKELNEQEMKKTVGGVKWACPEHGYVSHNHVFLATANEAKNTHNVKYHNGANVAYIM